MRRCRAQMAVDRWDPEWTSEEKLAVAVVHQAVWDVRKGREGKVITHGTHTYPLASEVEDAAQFLEDRFWERDNLWRQVLEPHLRICAAKLGMRHTLGRAGG